MTGVRAGALTAAALLVGGPLLSGCAGSVTGGAAGPRLDSAFRGRVDAVCSDSLSARKQHPFPLKHFDPHQPGAARLPAVAAYFSTYGQAGLVAERLTDLGEPASAVHEWDALRSVIRQEAENAKDQISTAATTDVTAFRMTVDRADALHDQVVKLGTSLGFNEDSACGQLFG